MPKEYVNPSDLPDWSHYFSQVVLVNGDCKTIYVSGEVSVDDHQNLIGEGNLAV